MDLIVENTVDDSLELALGSAEEVQKNEGESSVPGVSSTNIPSGTSELSSPSSLATSQALQP